MPSAVADGAISKVVVSPESAKDDQKRRGKLVIVVNVVVRLTMEEDAQALLFLNKELRPQQKVRQRQLRPEERKNITIVRFPTQRRGSPSRARPLPACTALDAGKTRKQAMTPGGLATKRPLEGR